MTLVADAQHAVRYAIAQLRALRWALHTEIPMEVQTIADYLIGVETTLRRATGDGSLSHVEPESPRMRMQ